MKRIFLLALSMALLIPIATNAVTKRAAPKKTRTTQPATVSPKTSACLSAANLCTYIKEPQFGRIVVHKDYDSIVNALRTAGWSAEKRNETRLDYTGTEYEDVTIYTLSKTVDAGNTIIVLDEDIFIHFPNATDCDAFIASLKAFGYKMRGGRLTGGPDSCYWLGSIMERDGNTITLIPVWEP